MSDRNLTFSSNKLPTRQEAFEQLDAWLTRKAFEQAGGATTKAGRILGVSRIWANKLKKRYIKNQSEGEE